MAAPLEAPSSKGAYITEVVVQGIRRFGEVRRFTLGPGYNVLYGLSAAGKSTLYDVILSLLFARPAEGEGDAFRSMLPGGDKACRAGMSLLVGGETFRVLKDYQAKSVTLSRYIAAEKRFELVASEPPRIQRWLTEKARLTVGANFGRMFTLTRQDFPSTTEVVVSIKTTTADPNFEDRIRALSLGDKRSLLAQLTDEYRRQAEVKTTEFLQDGLRTKLFEVDTLIKKRDEAKQKLDEIQVELVDIEKLPKLPDGIDERLEAFKRQMKAKEAEMEHLIPRQEDAHGQLAMVIPPPFDEADMRRLTSPMDIVVALIKKNRIVDGGIAAIVVGMVMLFFGGIVSELGAAMMVAGIIIAAVWQGLLVFLKGKEKYDASRKIADAVDEQVRLVERKFDIETTVVRNLMKAYGVESPTEMKEIEKRRDELVTRRDAARALLATVRLPDGGTEFDAKRNQIQKQIANIDERLQQLSGNFTADPKDLETQIERLEREVARAEGRKALSRAKLFGREEGEEGDGRDAIQRTVEAWAGGHRADLGKLLRATQDAFAKNLRAVSGGRFADANFDANGSISVREDGRPPIPFESLDGLGKDAAYLAVRLTLLQLDSRGQSSVVALLDDPFEFEEPRLAAISRAFKALGPQTQILHLTSRPTHQRLADVALEI
jgi:uncharacterized protein YhaN